MSHWVSRKAGANNRGDLSTGFDFPGIVWDQRHAVVLNRWSEARVGIQWMVAEESVQLIWFPLFQFLPINLSDQLKSLRECCSTVCRRRKHANVSSVHMEQKQSVGALKCHVSHHFCFAPARVKVKHYGYDPIGTWGKWRCRGPQNEKQRIAEHFAKKAVWPPRAICYAMGKITKNWFVMCDSLSSHCTSGRPRLRDSILSKFACQPIVQVQCPRIDDQDCWCDLGIHFISFHFISTRRVSDTWAWHTDALWNEMKNCTRVPSVERWQIQLSSYRIVLSKRVWINKPYSNTHRTSIQPRSFRGPNPQVPSTSISSPESGFPITALKFPPIWIAPAWSQFNSRISNKSYTCSAASSGSEDVGM